MANGFLAHPIFDSVLAALAERPPTPIDPPVALTKRERHKNFQQIKRWQDEAIAGASTSA